MKIIDLLNKIAKGEELPNKIAYTPLDGCRYILKYDELKEDYYDGKECLMGSAYNIIYHLNDEIEIIEEEKEIEELPIIKNADNTTLQGKDFNYTMKTVDVILANKINELVREVRKLKESK